QCLGDPAVAPGFAGLRRIGLQQDTCLQHLPRGALTLLDQRAEPLALLVAELHDVLLRGRLLRGHDASPMLPEASIQRSTAKSTTCNTSPIAVGTPITGRPPHRTVRAAFPHTAPTLGV